MGWIPNLLWKHLAKYEGLLNPEEKVVSVILWSDLSKSSDLCSRYSRSQLLGDIPVRAIHFLYSWDLLTPTSLQYSLTPNKGSCQDISKASISCSKIVSSVGSINQK